MSQVMLTGRDSQHEFCLGETVVVELRCIGTRFAFDLRHWLAKELVNQEADSRLLRRLFTPSEDNLRAHVAATRGERHDHAGTDSQTGRNDSHWR